MNRPTAFNDYSPDRSMRSPLAPSRRRPKPWILACVALLTVSGCATKPPAEHYAEMQPANLDDIVDGRARFREIFCAVTDERGTDMPDYRPCDEVLVKLASEGPPTSDPVHLGGSAAPLTLLVVPGLGWNCFDHYVDPKETAQTRVARS